MKRGFAIGRFITSQTNGSWLDEGESPTTVVHRSKFEAKHFVSFSLNEMVLFLYIVLMKATLLITTTILKIA